jgi:hypothetical protein
MRAPIFFDTNNTNYYVNPASTSNLNGLTVAGTITGSISGNADTVDGYHASTTRNSANTIPIRDGNGYLNLGWINTTSGNTTSTLTDIYVNTNDGYIRKATPAHFRSQITDGVYLPIGGKAADSNLLDGIDSNRVVYGNGPSKVNSQSNANSQVNSGFYENAGGGSNWPSSTWYNSINVRHSNQGNYHGFQTAMSYYDNLFWFRSYQGSGTFQTWEHALSSGGTSQTKSGTLQSNNSLRAPIFYDSNSTSYYLDPSNSAKAANLRGNVEIINETPVLELNDFTATNNTNLNGWVSFQRNGTEAGYVGYGSTSTDYLYLSNYSGRVYINGSFTEHENSSRAPIFYDSNNTNYYTNPYGTSVLKNLTLRNDNAQGYYDGTIEFRSNSNSLGSHIEYTAGPGFSGYKIYISASGASTSNVQYELEDRESTFQSGTMHIKNNIVNGTTHSQTGTSLLNTPALKVYQRATNISYSYMDLVTFHATSTVSHPLRS